MLKVQNGLRFEVQLQIHTEKLLFAQRSNKLISPLGFRAVTAGILVDISVKPLADKHILCSRSQVVPSGQQ